ncbi:chemotaxis protein CheW [Pseudomonas stutzeri]|uniref:Chemotaxis protein CheW n=1 Tax=Stutzerimonas stutzeri TaxID=316 RepID=A0A2N8S794_STUST|nr:CheW domain-containing protein [Stutzerimonas stutzeri]MCQ4294811.1 chemotaxis protein CheW [Stutzerimonas stutzeri]PNF82496.1 chemotaxis protein CheW [Stutzerimonas stutzeri]
MSRTVLTETRSQLALQSYLDGLLQDAAIELADSVSQDEFQAAVLEEQLRDTRQSQPPRLEIVQPVPPVSVPAELVVLPPMLSPEPVIELEIAPQPPSEPARVETDNHPGWGDEPFECLLFDVAGLTLAVPLVCLGSIYPLADQELTPLFGQPDWFLGILPSQAGNLKVLDTARWVMPDRYREDFREGLQYVISVQGYEWGLAVHQVSRSIRLDPSEVKWRTQRSQRPWLAGTVIEHMCALVDVTALAELISSGAVKQMPGAVKPRAH